MRVRAPKPLMQMAVAGALFSLSYINAEQEYAKTVGKCTQKLIMSDT